MSPSPTEPEEPSGNEPAPGPAQEPPADPTETWQPERGWRTKLVSWIIIAMILAGVAAMLFNAFRRLSAPP